MNKRCHGRRRGGCVAGAMAVKPGGVNEAVPEERGAAAIVGKGRGAAVAASGDWLNTETRAACAAAAEVKRSPGLRATHCANQASNSAGKRPCRPSSAARIDAGTR